MTLLNGAPSQWGSVQYGKWQAPPHSSATQGYHKGWGGVCGQPHHEAPRRVPSLRVKRNEEPPPELSACRPRNWHSGHSEWTRPTTREAVIIHTTKNFNCPSLSHLFLRGWGSSSLEILTLLLMCNPRFFQMGTPLPKICGKGFLEMDWVEASVRLFPREDPWILTCSPEFQYS